MAAGVLNDGALRSVVADYGVCYDGTAESSDICANDRVNSRRTVIAPLVVPAFIGNADGLWFEPGHNVSALSRALWRSGYYHSKRRYFIGNFVT